MRRAWRVAWVGLVVLVVGSVALSGCISEDSKDLIKKLANTIECSDATGVDNQAGSFEYGGAASCKTETERYDWQNPAPRAAVEWGGAVALGYLNVTIYDGLDRVVHEFSLDGSGASGASGNTELGVPGAVGWSWSIELEFANFTGTMGLSVDMMQ